MKKLFLIVFIGMILTAQTVNAENLIPDDKAAHLLAGSFLEEHLKSKGVEPLHRFAIITGISIMKELFDKQFDGKDIQFAILGIGFSFTFDEIGKFLHHNIIAKPATTDKLE